MMDTSPNSDEPSNNVESANAFSKIRLSATEEDEVLIDLAQFLLKENLSEFADNCI